MKIIKAITLQLLVVIIFTSCNSFTSQPMIKPTNVPEASTSIINTEVVRTLPVATSTTTPIEFETDTKTPLPVNTLTAPEREKFVRDAISGNSSCKLPCWWDITPGETTWTEAEEFLQHLGVRIGAAPGYSPNAVFHGTGGFDFEGVSIKNGFSFEETNGIVDAILINSDGYNNLEEFQTLWKNYSPKRMLEAYGPPDRIWLRAHPATNPRQYGIYSLWLFYDELGFSILYEARVPSYFFGAPFFRICSETDPLLNIEVNTQSPDNPLALDRFDGILEEVRIGTDIGKLIVIHSLQEATGFDDTEIYNTFMQNEGACFAIPSNIWRAKP